MNSYGLNPLQKRGTRETHQARAANVQKVLIPFKNGARVKLFAGARLYLAFVLIPFKNGARVKPLETLAAFGIWS